MDLNKSHLEPNETDVKEAGRETEGENEKERARERERREREGEE